MAHNSLPHSYLQNNTSHDLNCGIGLEFTDLDELWGNGTGNGGVVETMGERRRGEKYKDCVKRVHKDMKEKILKANEFWCDALWFFDCGHFAAVYAIVMCNEYENQK